MIDKIIESSIRNRLIVGIVFILAIAWGLWALQNTPLDAIPDLSDNQVIVATTWMGRGPQVIEDQITYPLSAALQGLPRVKSVRATSMFGASIIYVIFEDNVDIYWARSRVLEKLNYAQSLLPTGVSPTLGPDGTGVGHVYWYVLESDQHDLGYLRTIQDWYLRYPLSAVDGVSEVASIGGFVKQYQIDLDPVKLLAYDLPLTRVIQAVKSSNADVGGRLLEMSDIEYVVRGLGYIKSIEDVENIVVGVTPEGTPIYVSNLGTVQLGGDIRRGLLDQNGEGEVVGGIIVMRYRENAKDVIDRVKARLAELEPGLPEGITIRTAYDRSELIENAVNTLRHTLTEEAIIVALIVLIFLMHFRSALVIILSLPIAVLISFIFMKYLGISSNIMSLGGVAIAIGVIVDASVVMVENAYRHISEAGLKSREEVTAMVITSAKQVGRPIFFSLLIIILSFVPVFLLTGQEGRLFKPLAFTKTFTMTGAAIISITLVPVLMTIFIRGKRLRTEQQNPLMRVFNAIYRSIQGLALRHRLVTLLITLLIVAATIPIAVSRGREFMPQLDEGSLLYMPVTLPNVTVTEAKRLLQVTDAIIKSVPEVEYVLGKVGRAETATDPAPVAMIETIILLKPQSEWRKGFTKADLIGDLNSRLQIPGLTNGWTQPIINRIQMLATGVRTDLGVKIFGPDLRTLGELALQVEEILRPIPGAADLYSERVVGGRYLDITIDRVAAARFGVRVGDIQMVIETAIGGMNLTTTVEGRERYPVRVRYASDYRSDPEAIERVLVPTAGGAQIPLEQVADITVSAGPPMINSENGMLRSLVMLNVRDRDMGSFVDAAKVALANELDLPDGYSLNWSGQYENQIRAKERLATLIPAVLLIILLLLYITFRSIGETLLVILSVPFALVGGVLLQWILGYNYSVAVWVGYIALTGIAVETGVVMLIYLNEALDKYITTGSASRETIRQAAIDGSVLRLRPKLMTVATSLIGLLPIMWSTGTGSDVMKPIATPVVGGIVTSLILILIVLPVFWSLLKEWELRRGRLRFSGMGHGGDEGVTST
ncbi:efflux RND transporter permease subunit [Gemmatimonadota bacterium]